MSRCRRIFYYLFELPPREESSPGQRNQQHVVVAGKILQKQLVDCIHTDTRVNMQRKLLLPVRPTGRKRICLLLDSAHIGSWQCPEDVSVLFFFAFIEARHILKHPATSCLSYAHHLETLEMCIRYHPLQGSQSILVKKDKAIAVRCLLLLRNIDTHIGIGGPGLQAYYLSLSTYVS